MNLKIFAPILIIILVLAASGFAAFTLLNAKTSTEFVLVRETGSILYKTPENDEYTSLDDIEITLPTGSSIKTEENSYGRVFLPDNSLVSIDQQTEVQINVKSKEVNIDQLIGKTWNRVQTVSKGGEYKVETPNTIAAVRGTIFGVGVDDDDHSRVFVEESEVEINRYQEKEEGKDQGKGEDQEILETIDLTADELAEIIRDEQSFRIEKSKTNEDFKKSFWYHRNKIIDEEIKKLKDKKGRNFRKLLQQALEKHEEFQKYRFGFGVDSPKLGKDEDINGKLKDVFDITKINEKSCESYALTDFQLAADKVILYKDYIENYEEIQDLLLNLKNSCDDKKLSIPEIENLRQEVDTINNE